MHDRDSPFVVSPKGPPSIYAGLKGDSGEDSLPEVDGTFFGGMRRNSAEGYLKTDRSNYRAGFSVSDGRVRGARQFPELVPLLIREKLTSLESRTEYFGIGLIDLS